MNFTPITLASREKLAPVFAAADTHMRDYTFASLYMWAGLYDGTYAEQDGLVFIRSRDDMRGGAVYAIPHRDRDFLAAVDILMREHPEGFALRSMSEENAALLRAHLGARAETSCLEAEADYVYEITDLADLPGRRFAAKRNHIHAILRAGACAYEPITAANLPEVLDFYRFYRENEEHDDPDAHEEGGAAQYVLENFVALGAVGGLLRLDGRPVGFFVGEVQGDMLYLHIEKARAEVRGAYPLLVREAAAAFRAHVRYENREEDDGNEGLRRSKRSWNPAFLVQKYRATVK